MYQGVTADVQLGPRARCKKVSSAVQKQLFLSIILKMIGVSKSIRLAAAVQLVPRAPRRKDLSVV